MRHPTFEKHICGVSLCDLSQTGDSHIEGSLDVFQVFHNSCTDEELSVLHADRTFADGTVLMTFPEGTEVNLADFNVCWSREIDGRASRFVRLATVANEDGTVSLVKSSYGTVISFR